MPTQLYDVQSVKFGRRFVRTLSVDLENVRSRKWNSEKMIFFQSVILQRSQGVNNYKHIHSRILFLLKFWNHGAFDKLVKVAFNAATGYLGKACGVQTEEQRHRTFSNLVLKGKLREAVRFFRAWQTGDFSTQIIFRGLNGNY